MKITLEGDQAEVMSLIQRIAGGIPASPRSSPQPSGGLTVPRPAAPEECPSPFRSLVEAWAKGFNPDGTAHWKADANAPASSEKADLLTAVANSRQNGVILRWVEGQEGLTYAVWHILGEKEDIHEMEVARGIAVNMAQVASILFPDLADLLEHFDPFKE